jgi:hypothetical protein
VCAGIGEEDVRVWTWWYGGETLSPGGRDDTRAVTLELGGVTGDMGLAGEGMFECNKGGVRS